MQYIDPKIAITKFDAADVIKASGETQANTYDAYITYEQFNGSGSGSANNILADTAAVTAVNMGI